MKSGFALLIAFLIVGLIVGACFLVAKLTKKEDGSNFVKNMWAKSEVKTITASLLCIVGGLLFGCIILLLFAGSSIGGLTISWKSAGDAIQLVFMGIFSKSRNADGIILYGWNGVNIGNMLFNTIPLLMCGLSVAIAFKTGLFNIGTPGQYLMGAAVTLILALVIPTSAIPAFIVWFIAFIGGILAGALWGCIPGIFKAYLNINEVITCIMTNWIAASLVTALFDKETGPFKFLLDPSGTKNNAYVFKTTHNGVATAKLGLDKIFKGSQVNAGIIVAIIIAILMWILISKTTLGYELKACGNNKNASKYAGINEKRNIILSMAIAGGLAGAGASLYFLSGNTEFRWETYQSLPGVAFNGIPVALLAMNNPLGVIFAALFMAYLDVAGMQIKYLTTYNEYITSIISAVIVYFSAFSLLILNILNGKFKKNKKIKKEVTESKENKQEEAKEEIEIKPDDIVVKEEIKEVNE